MDYERLRTSLGTQILTQFPDSKVYSTDVKTPVMRGSFKLDISTADVSFLGRERVTMVDVDIWYYAPHDAPRDECEIVGMGLADLFGDGFPYDDIWVPLTSSIHLEQLDAGVLCCQIQANIYESAARLPHDHGSGELMETLELNDQYDN